MLKRCTYEKTKEIFFKENELSYYLLGAFITDGNVIQDKSRTNSFKISLSSKDKDWLELIQHEFEGEGRLKQTKGNQYELRLYNKKIYDWLIQHGCTPRKSLSLTMPNIPEQYFKDFLRGCMDGDGSISITHYKATKNAKTYSTISIYLCGSSLDFIRSISEKLNKLGLKHNLLTINTEKNHINGKLIGSKNPNYRIQFSGRKRGTPFLEWLYHDCKLAMPRKQNLAIKILNNDF